MKTNVQQRQNAVIPALLLAAHAGREAEVQALLDAGADANVSDGDGITPLMAAAMNGGLSLARLLLSAGASRGICNKWGMTAHVIAQWHGHDALAALLDETERLHGGMAQGFGKARK